MELETGRLPPLFDLVMECTVLTMEARKASAALNDFTVAVKTSDLPSKNELVKGVNQFMSIARDVSNDLLGLRVDLLDSMNGCVLFPHRENTFFLTRFIIDSVIPANREALRVLQTIDIRGSTLAQSLVNNVFEQAVFALVYRLRRLSLASVSQADLREARITRIGRI